MKKISLRLNCILIYTLIFVLLLASLVGINIKPVFAATTATLPDSGNPTCPKSMTITANRSTSEVSVTASWQPASTPPDGYGVYGTAEGKIEVVDGATSQNFRIKNGEKYTITFNALTGPFGTKGEVLCGTIYVDATSNTAVPTVSKTPITPPPGGGSGGGTGGGGSTGSPGGYVSSSTDPICPQNVKVVATKSGSQAKVTLTWQAPKNGTTGGLSYTVTRMVKATAADTFALDKTESPGAAFPKLEELVDTGKIYGYIVESAYGSGATCKLGLFEVNTIGTTPVASITNGSTMPTPGVSGGGGATGKFDCTASCPSGYLFGLIPSIQSAMCDMQCTIIDWEAGIIGWMVGSILYPALGI